MRLCACPNPHVLNDIGRLNVLCIFLILPLMYHVLMAWTSGRPVHSTGLFVFAVLFPLCGMINTIISVMAAFFVAPLLLRALAAQQRQKRLVACLLPLFLAAGLDALLLAPWLLDRSDLGCTSATGSSRSSTGIRCEDLNDSKLSLRFFATRSDRG